MLLVARSDRELRGAADQCAREGGRAEPFTCDVTAPDAGDRMAQAAAERLGPVDVLVNNAGTARWRDLDDVPDEDWQAAWDVNVMACLRATRAVVPGMRERGWGRVVNVSSTAAKRPSAQHARVLGREGRAALAVAPVCRPLAGDGVLVNAICPGPTRSELWVGEGGLADQSAELSGLAGRDEALAKAGEGRPIGRLAEVGEIAAAIVFLCSERASYVAGAAWSVDGGTVPVII